MPPPRHFSSGPVPASTALEPPAFRASRPQSTSAYPGTKVLPGHPSGASNLPNWDPTPMARSQELARLFQEPDSPAQRHYEICRAYFCESAPADEIAKRFHLHSSSVRAIVRDFAHAPDVNGLFAAARPGPKTAPKRDAIHERACELRRQGATLADIRAALGAKGSTSANPISSDSCAVPASPLCGNIVRHRSRASTPATVP